MDASDRKAPRFPGSRPMCRIRPSHGQERMIIDGQEQVTDAVLAELARAKNPRFKEVMGAFVHHLHDFAREVKLTEEEFQAAISYIIALGKHTTEAHNEAVLMSGSLGF